MIETIYCDFGCRRPEKTENGLRYGIFSVAMYAGTEDKKCIWKRVVMDDLWEDSSYVTAIQSYKYALDAIYKAQEFIRKAGIKRVMLRSESAALINLICEPRSKKEYAEYMEMANSPYRIGSVKEITLGVGVCDRVKYERSRKYCKEENVTDDLRVNSKERLAEKSKKHVLKTGTVNILGKVNNTRKTVFDVIEDSNETPEIEGFKEVSDIDI